MLPRIHTLSTVGVLKHHLQDYPFHWLRTDFVGANGTGKSIIADLLQLIFIHDAKLIHFGTDGVNPEERSVHELAHNTSIAYCFLNVEVKEDRFVLMGVALPQRTTLAVTPFLILKSSDLTIDLSESGLTKDELLYARDFITERSTIPEPRQLAQHLRKQELHLSFFSSREHIHDYYHFLSRQNVLPINLARRESQKAFAKVLQSFSKAKTLKLGVSASIKEFLFDEADSEFSGEYESQQAELKKLMLSYRELSDYISKLRAQQSRLIRLKELDTEKGKAEKQYRTAKVFKATDSVSKVKADANHVKEQLENERQSEKKIGSAIKRLPELFKWADETSIKADDTLNDVEHWGTNILRQTQLYEQLNILKLLPTINAEADKSENDSNANNEDSSAIRIKDAVEFASPFIEKYGSLAAIDKQGQAYTEMLRDALIGLQNKQDGLSSLISIMEGGSPDSFLAWAIARGGQLTAEQEAIVLAFKDAAITKPIEPVTNQRHISDPMSLLNLSKEEGDNQHGGAWLPLGFIEQFITLPKGQRLFETSDNNGLEIGAKLEELRQEAAQLKAHGEAVLEAIKGVESPLMKSLGFVIDYALLNMRELTRIKDGVRLSKAVPMFVRQTEQEIKEIESWIDTFTAKHSIDSQINNVTQFKQVLERRKSQRSALSRKLYGRLTGANAEKSANEKELKRFRDEYIRLTALQQEAETELERLRLSYFADFKEHIETKVVNDDFSDVERYKSAADTKKSEYALYYQQTAGMFEETNNGADIAVASEIESGTYGFLEMERALLGQTVAHTDKIDEALTKANNDRYKLIESIQSDVSKVFKKTSAIYKSYSNVVRRINSFFATRKISDRFQFKLNFSEHPLYKITFLEEFQERIATAHRMGELHFERPVGEHIEELFVQIAQLKEKASMQKLLNPKTYFELSVSLTDEAGKAVPGSTGEAYSAIALLGIARLSRTEEQQRTGLRFLILEEVGSLDSINFSTFPAIAQEFGYQIITMSPKPYGANLSEEWYMHHLVKGRIDEDINHPPFSYYYTPNGPEEIPPLKMQTL